VPSHVLGRGGTAAPNSRLNLAFIGVGSQGLRVLLNFLRQPDVQAVSVCDVVTERDDYPQWGEREFRDAVATLLGGSAPAWVEALSTRRPIRLTRTLTVTAGVAGTEPCRRIINAYYGRNKASGSYRGCTAHADFRELLAKETDVDGVVVCTPDHWHALIAIAAMERGKHVYCQKPMTHSVAEARRMAEVARATAVATQVAVGPQAAESTRVLCEWIASGAIGPVREVVNWSNRPVWPQGLERPTDAPAVPRGLDWDLWLGPAPARPFHPVYLPFVWRGWYDFGCGAIGDMGCYSFDVIFRALQLTPPTRIEASSSELMDDCFPKACLMRFQFPARGDRPPVILTWYDGGLLPPLLDRLGPIPALDKEGLLFLGDRGAILCGFTGENPRLLPEAAFRDFTPPPKSLPRSIGHDREWIEACKGAAAKPGANFEFSSAVTETILLGNVALRAGQRIEWDTAAMKAGKNPAADRLVNPPCRAPWRGILAP